MKIKGVFILLALIGAVTVQAQTQKIGYTNAEYILSLLPETKSIEQELTSYESQLQNQARAKYQDMQQKAAAFEQRFATATQADQQMMRDSLQRMQTSFQEFQMNAENSLAKKRNQLLQPAVEKIGNAIKAVAEENGYTHVLSAGSPGVDVLLYANEESDITDLVLKKLGINPPAGE
jgi:outer membrane protein